MKILIVEDIPEKARAIATAIEEAGISSEHIQIIPDLQQAKRTLSEVQVSLLILDLRIPARFDKSPHVNGGTDLLEWIEREENLQKPAVTIALSAVDIDDSLRRELAGYGVLFVAYEAFNTTWREFIIAFVRRLGAFPGASVRSNAESPVVVLTAVDIELRHAKRIFACSDEPLIRGGVSWHQGSIDGHHALPVVVAKSPQMGMPAAAILCAQALNVWVPPLVIMVGICAGIKGEAELGDLVVADPVWDYNSGKLDAAGHLHADPRQIPLNARTRTLVDSLVENGEILQVGKEWSAQKPDRISRVLRRPAASGSAVVTDPRVSEMVASQGRKAAAIDMEAYGLYYAAENIPHEPIDFLSVKVVVDHADGSKGDSFQPFGAHLSCCFARIFIKRWANENRGR